MKRNAGEFSDLEMCQCNSKFLLRLTLLGHLTRLLFMVLTSFLMTFPALSKEYVTDGSELTERRQAVLQMHQRRDPHSRNCDAQPLSCQWPEITRAIAVLAAPRSPADAPSADKLLQNIAVDIAKYNTSISDKKYGKTSEKHEIRPSDEFFFLTSALLLRAENGFLKGERENIRSISKETYESIVLAFWTWGNRACKIDDASVNKVWSLKSSENIDLMRAHACWATAELVSKNIDQKYGRYADGSTAKDQVRAWNRYVSTFLNKRSEVGLSIEFFSPTYSRYFLGSIYNFADFSSDPALRKDASDFLTLWWALWAQEQIAGTHGGSKARAYPEAIRKGDPSSGLGWLYFNVGAKDGVFHPAVLPMVLSNYHPPSVITEIVHHDRVGSSYEVWTHHAGMLANFGDGRRDALSSDGRAVVRYAYVGRGFVMGSATGAAVPVEKRANISTQNRWNGVVTADIPSAKIYLRASSRGRSNYNAFAVSQVLGVQVATLNHPDFGKSGDRVDLCFEGELKPIKSDGWLFFEGKSYVAVRVIDGAMTVTPTEKGVSNCWPVSNALSPVLIYATDTSAVDSFDTFIKNVKAANISFRENVIHVDSISGINDLKLPTEMGKQPSIGGVPFQSPDEWTLYSPFVQQRRGEREVVIMANGQQVKIFSRAVSVHSGS